MRIGSLELKDDLSPAGWIVDRIHDFAVDVGSVVPESFEAYARLFHPAIRIEDGKEVTVRWSEIADANGRTVHAEMQWGGISGVCEHTGETSPGLWDLEPEVGSLPLGQVNRLMDLLIQHTSTPNQVWFGVWEGFGGLKIRPGGTVMLSSGGPGSRRRQKRPPSPAPTFQLPNRSYYLLSGPLEAIRESMCEGPGWQSANLLWPQDRSWCVATEVDFAWTYVGGDETLIKALVEDQFLEAIRTQIHYGITYESDCINPSSDRP